MGVGTVGTLDAGVATASFENSEINEQNQQRANKTGTAHISIAEEVSRAAPWRRNPAEETQKGQKKNLSV